MSLFAFPPLNTEGKPFAIQEFNGRIVTGSEEEFLAVNRSYLISDYPSIDRTQLRGLQHSISKENVKNVFAGDVNKGQRSSWSEWANETAESTKHWSLSALGRGVLRVHNGVSSIASRVLPSHRQEKIEDLMEKYGPSFDWKKDWIRCISIHPNGSRVAVCQPNDYIRIFAVGQATKTPLTLKHPKQENVSCMEWEPFDQRVLAVAAANNILIWRLTTKSINMKPSAQCAQVIETSMSPLTQLVWDRIATRVILASSPDSNKILSVDTLREDIECIGSWSWGAGSITRMIPSEDGTRLAVLYTSNIIKVFDRSTWENEKWGQLKGRAVDAVWSPNGDALLFVTEDSCHLHSISFVQHSKAIADGKFETKWEGEAIAKQVFDLSPVEFDSSEAEIRGAVERPLIEIGGRVHRLVLSPDGRKLVVSFRDFPTVVATFSVDWHPFPRLTPSGFVEAPGFGVASIATFMPDFKDGSLLCIVWSEGHVQYLPFIYAPNASMIIQTMHIKDMISGRSSALSTSSLLSKRPPSASDSLRSSDLPSGLVDRSADKDGQELLMTERIRRNLI